MNPNLQNLLQQYGQNPYLQQYITPYQNQQNIDNLYNNYRNMVENNPYMQMQQAQQNPAMGQRGAFIEVKSFKEVETFPVQPDGTPTLFFDYANCVFWSKKFMQGKPCIQAFVFSPLNGSSQNSNDNMTSEDKEQQANGSIKQSNNGVTGVATEAGNSDPMIDAIFQKLDEMDKRFTSYDKKLKKIQNSAKDKQAKKQNIIETEEVASDVD